MENHHRSAPPGIALLLLSLVWLNQAIPADNDFIQAAEQAWPMIENGALLVDVRTEQEFVAGHLEGAINIPYDQTNALMAAIGNDKQREVVFYCRTGNRVGKAMVILKSKGYTSIFNAKSFAALKETQP